MSFIKKESLENLRRRVDLVDLLGVHLDLKRMGAYFKALCPFHDEKSPSFVVQRGDSHYHCFGCGAHGDAIEFLMSHMKLNFVEAVQHLAERFQVPLEYEENEEVQKGIAKDLLYQALEESSLFFHEQLLGSEEGLEPLLYLEKRGISIDFIKRFQLGLAPKKESFFLQKMREKGISEAALIEAGLLRETAQGFRPFFSDRITIPIYQASGRILGFSARKWKEETFGGKYINTPETPLFKKSRILFGLNECRRRIAKERRAVIVEGQLDALRLIFEGLNATVASQGTAFGEGHVQELLQLGVNQVYLAFDSDEAGRKAAIKVGNLFQKAGVEAWIIILPSGKDPDAYVREQGMKAFIALLQKKEDYLSFLVAQHTLHLNLESPAAKQELVQTIASQIRTWDHDLMVHESLRKLARLTEVPEELVGIGKTLSPTFYIQNTASARLHDVNAYRVLEMDFLRWMLSMGGSHPHFFSLAKGNIEPAALKDTVCRSIYETILEQISEETRPLDRLDLLAHNRNKEVARLLDILYQKKINKERGEGQFLDTIQKILERNWLQEREELHQKIVKGEGSEEEQISWLKRFNELSRNRPKLQGFSVPESEV